MSSAHLISKFERLSAAEALILQFYASGFDKLPSKVGCVSHFKFLKSIVTNDPDFDPSDSWSETKHPLFYTRAKRLVSLFNQAKAAGIDPLDHIPYSESLAHRTRNDLGGATKIPSPSCPYTKAEFKYLDDSFEPARIIGITAHRILLSSLATKQDLRYIWQPGNKILKVQIRYSDMMKYPVDLVSLVTDDNGTPIFDRGSSCLLGFVEDISKRREKDGNVYDTFELHFKKEQETQFVQLNRSLTGFDLLRGKYINSDGEVCYFKILQLVTREKVHDDVEGTATDVDCGTITPTG